MPNPAAIQVGPGLLYIADLGSTEPSDLVTAWPGAWTALGYTFEGSTFSYQLETEDVEVAEELDAVRVVPTGRQINFRFKLAEVTATNMKRALNGGVITAPGGAFVYFEPPTYAEITRKMFGWQSDDAQERLILRQCINVGNIEMERHKGADKAGYDFDLRVEVPSSGSRPFRQYFASPARA